MRVRIRIRDVEVDLEGPEEFLEEHRHRWEPLLDLAAGAAAASGEALFEAAADGGGDAGGDEAEDEPSTAPYDSYSADLTDYDKVLAACYHAQQSDPDHAFRWPEAARVAVRSGLAAADAAAEFQYLLDIRHVLRVKRGTYRVSAKGVEALHKLMPAPRSA